MDSCYALADKWQALNADASSTFTPSAADIDGWMANQTVVFLEKIEDFSTPLKPEVVDRLGSTYGLATSHNVELVVRYYVIGLMAKAESVRQPAADLLGKVGRMKFVRPLYRHLVAWDRKFAEETFERHRDFYHPICRAMVEKILAK